MSILVTLTSSSGGGASAPGAGVSFVTVGVTAVNGGMAGAVLVVDPSGNVLGQASLGPGLTLSGGVLNVAGTVFTAENKDAVTFGKGQPLAGHSSGSGVVLASGADNNHNCVGLATAGVAAGLSETVQTDGPLTLSDWTAATGGVSLSAKAAYYLSATPGLLTATPPSAAGQVVQRVGVAVAPDTLWIEIGPAILL